MDRITITGGNRLNGTIPISGAKNAALPLMIASLLTKETVTLENMPLLADVTLLERILGNHGVDYAISGKRPGETPNSGRTVHLTAREIVDTTAPYELVSRMRASFWVLAPLLARVGEARVSLPGGCAIGTRPVDLLLMALESSARRSISRTAMSSQALKADCVAPKSNFQRSRSAARIPQSWPHRWRTATPCCATPHANPRSWTLPIASSRWARTSKARANRLSKSKASAAQRRAPSVLPDRIETGTYAMAVAMAGGDVLLAGARARLLQAALDVLERAGVEVSERQRRAAHYAQRFGHLGRRRDDRSISRLSDRFAGAIHGADDSR